jgi:hypothetical protein
MVNHEPWGSATIDEHDTAPYAAEEVLQSILAQDRTSHIETPSPKQIVPIISRTSVAKERQNARALGPLVAKPCPTAGSDEEFVKPRRLNMSRAHLLEAEDHK